MESFGWLLFWTGLELLAGRLERVYLFDSNFFRWNLGTSGLSNALSLCHFTLLYVTQLYHTELLAVSVAFVKRLQISSDCSSVKPFLSERQQQLLMPAARCFIACSLYFNILVIKRHRTRGGLSLVSLYAGIQYLIGGKEFAPAILTPKIRALAPGFVQFSDATDRLCVSDF